MLALLCHLLALIGNLHVADTISAVGKTSDGWADVGQGLAGSLSEKLDRRMQQTTEGMTAAITALAAVKTRLHDLEQGVGIVQAWRNSSTVPTAGTGGYEGGPELKDAAKRLAQAAAEELLKFREFIKAVLLQVKEWLVAFGDETQATVEGFSAGVDVVQYLVDQIMSKLRSSGKNEQRIRYESYNLFDVTGTGQVTLGDLQNVSFIYSIPALQGSKAQELFTIYDSDRSGELSRKEFALLVHDKALPGVMAVMLRAYARQLTSVAGLLESARMRDEIAYATMEYLRLVCAKNMTKVGWVAAALSNSSLPLEFTADVLAQIALASEHPGKSLTALDVGEALVDKMVEFSPQHTVDVMALLANTSTWESSGLSPDLQYAVVERVTHWVTKATQAQAVAPLLLRAFRLPRPNISSLTAARHSQSASSSSNNALMVAEEELPPHRSVAAIAEPQADEGALLQVPRPRRAPARQLGSEDGRHLSWEADPSGATRKRELEVEEEEAALLQHASRRLSREEQAPVLEEPRPRAAAGAPEAQLEALPRVARRCVAHGRRQHERGRRMSRLQQHRASLDALKSPREAFAYLVSRLEKEPHGMSGNADPDALRVISSGVPAQPETLRFARWLTRNASHTAGRLQDQCFDYTMHSHEATQRITDQVMRMMKRFQSFLGMLERYAKANTIDRLDGFVVRFARRLEEDLVHSLDNVGDHNLKVTGVEEVMGTVKRVWAKVGPLLDELASVLPMCIDDLKFARRAVSSTSAVLRATFTTLKDRVPPVFEGVSKVYRAIWIVYFGMFVLLTVALTLYSLWASGHLDSGEGQEQEEPSHERPRTWSGRFHTCVSSCGACFQCWDDRQVAFWSALLFMEALWLIMFVASQGMLMVMGISSFLAAGCGQVHMLVDESLCNEVLGFVSAWLGTYTWIAGTDAREACGQKELLLCRILTERLGGAMKLASVGNTIAAFATFQMIVEMAVMHERHRFRALLEARKAM